MSHLQVPHAVSKPAVLVLSTLHQYHTEVSCYGFSTLRRILTNLAPDALFAEVRDQDLRSRNDEQVKREYPEVVYPLLDEIPSIRAHALEPSGVLHERLVQSVRAAEKQFQMTPKYVQFEAYVQSWARELFAGWKTAADVNSEESDAAAKKKHEYQDKLYPPDYSQAWNDWNEHFYDRIIEVAGRTKPGLAVVLVGFEHSYWLRPRLARRSDMTLLDARATLENM
jgi:hypothetical protein